MTEFLSGLQMKKSSIHDGVSFLHYSPDFTIAIKINALHMMGEKIEATLSSHL